MQFYSGATGQAAQPRNAQAAMDDAAAGLQRSAGQSPPLGAPAI